MYTKTVVQEIASTVSAYKRCVETGNDWAEKHLSTIRWLEDMLPSGSGINCGTKVDVEKTSDEKVVLSMSFHHMSDSGMYDGWTEHTITVTPSFHGIDIAISGKDRSGIKEYLYQVYEYALTEVCFRIEDGGNPQYGRYFNGEWKPRKD